MTVAAAPSPAPLSAGNSFAGSRESTPVRSRIGRIVTPGLCKSMITCDTMDTDACIAQTLELALP